jgi:hypothetical protein
MSPKRKQTDSSEIHKEPKKFKTNEKRRFVLNTMKLFVKVLKPDVLQTVLNDSLSQYRYRKTITSQEFSNLFEGTDPAKMHVHKKFHEEYFEGV